MNPPPVSDIKLVARIITGAFDFSLICGEINMRNILDTPCTNPDAYPANISKIIHTLPAWKIRELHTAYILRAAEWSAAEVDAADFVEDLQHIINVVNVVAEVARNFTRDPAATMLSILGPEFCATFCLLARF